jgi:hypothetical protein
MLSKEDFIVLRHYLGEGVSKTAIARAGHQSHDGLPPYQQ